MSHLISFHLTHVAFFSPKRREFNHPYKFDKQRSYETSRCLILSVFLYFLLLCSKYFLEQHVLFSNKLRSFFSLETKLYKYIKVLFITVIGVIVKLTVANAFGPQNGGGIRGCRPSCYNFH